MRQKHLNSHAFYWKVKAMLSLHKKTQHDTRYNLVAAKVTSSKIISYKNVSWLHPFGRLAILFLKNKYGKFLTLPWLIDLFSWFGSTAWAFSVKIRPNVYWNAFQNMMNRKSMTVMTKCWCRCVCSYYWIHENSYFYCWDWK